MAANTAAAESPITHDRLGRPILGPCLIWTKALDRKGYGVVGNKDFGSAKVQRTHRVAYAIASGVSMREIHSVPELDHLCRVTQCCAVMHLEPVTHGENMRRGDLNAEKKARTHCPQGHPYIPANTIYVRGGRNCRTCKNDRERATYDPVKRAARHRARKARIGSA